MGMSPSKISRIETGITGLQIEDVAALLGLYQVPTSAREELLDLVRRAEERGWWTRQPGLPKLGCSLIDFEARATRVQNYEALVVPGLVQTAEYARAVIQGIAPTITPAELDNLGAARMARQALLTRSDAPQFWAVNCVEVAFGGPVVTLRDSKKPHRQRADPPTNRLADLYHHAARRRTRPLTQSTLCHMVGIDRLRSWTSEKTRTACWTSWTRTRSPQPLSYCATWYGSVAR